MPNADFIEHPKIIGTISNDEAQMPNEAQNPNDKNVVAPMKSGR